MTTPPAITRDVTTDFSLVVATANGTGSQTANLTLLRACFHMGIPVCGKNIFPSNIQGLPTWYHIRVSKDGYVARRTSEVLVAFNQATVDADLRELPSGGVAIVDEGLAHGVQRDDVHLYTVPVKALMAASEHKGKLRDYLANMTYVGVLAHLLDIPLDAIEAGLDAQFGGKRRLVDTNLAVVRGAHAWAVEQLTKTDPFRVAPMDATRDLLIMSGNEAGALGSVFGGVSVAAWYPITPSTSFVDALRDYLPELRQDEDGAPTYTVVQAEDELAAIGMVIGAGFAGARAVTATSGPGISLMAEFAGLGAFAEVPGVIWDVQRVGPSTGMPTRTSQGDLAFTYGLGHGDGKHVVLLPSSIEECFEFGWRSFEYPDGPMQRGKVLAADEVRERGFARYRDIDGDGVAYRTLPGNDAPGAAYFARGTGHNAQAVYSERSDDWLENTARLARKFDTARRLVPPALEERVEGAGVGIVAFGTTRYAIEEARDALAADGLRCSSMRLRALPIGEVVRAFIEAHELVVVVEMNRDGQLAAILRAELPDLAPRIESVAYLDGMPFTAGFVRERIEPYLTPRSLEVA